MFQVIDRAAAWWLQWRTDRHVDELKKTNPEEFGGFTKVQMDPNGMTLVKVAPELMVLAHEAVALLDAHNAKNYVEFEFFPRLDRGIKPVVVTVRFKHGEAPGQKAARLEKELGLVRGAMRADDERLWRAGERVGIEHEGCDTADALADEILRLRSILDTAGAA